jgi:uncharacterized protein YqeY
MGIFDEVSSHLKDAMRAREKSRVSALRNIRAAFLAATKEDGSDTLSDEGCVTLLRRLEKQRNESIAAFEAGNREELAAAERAELAVIQGFLPSLADEPTTRAWVQEAIASTGASSTKDVGRVLGLLMKSHKGEVDGKLAKTLAEAMLTASSS